MEWIPIDSAPKDGEKILAYGSYQWQGCMDDAIVGVAVVIFNNSEYGSKK